jgi:MFS family permease
MDKNNKIIYLLSTLGFFGIFSTTMAKNPVLPLYVNALGQGESVIGLISAISPLAGIIFSFPVGLLIDKWGKKKLLIISSLVFVLAPLMYIFVTNAWWLIPVRFFHGFATAILGPLSATIIFHAYEKNKGEKLGTYSSATLIGRTLAPLFGGMIISYFTFFSGLWNYRLVYLAVFILALPVLPLALMYKDDGENKLSNKSLNFSILWQAIKNIFSQAKLVSTALVEMSIYFIFGVLETFLPLYLYNLGFSGTKIGLIFSIQILAIALTKPLFGRLADRINKRSQIVFGMLILSLSFVLIPFLHNYWLVLILSIVFGLGMSISTVATNSYVPEIIRKEDLGGSMGALSSLMDVGHSSGPFVVGLIITYFSFGLGFVFSLFIALLATIYFMICNFRKIVSY